MRIRRGETWPRSCRRSAVLAPPAGLMKALRRPSEEQDTHARLSAESESRLVISDG